MSTVTKIFVFLLVVLSLLLSAATVTFVNTVENDKMTAQNTIKRLEAAEASATEAAARYEGQVAAATAELSKLGEQVNLLRQQSAAKDKDLATAAASEAAARTGETMAKADVNRLTSALNASTASSSEAGKSLASLRGEFDKLTAQLNDLNIAFNDTSNKLSVTEAQRRSLAEQFAEAKTSLDKFRDALKDRGIDPDRVVGGVGAGAPSINGVVRSTFNTGGVDYAVISVGSEDAVKAGMEFNGLDQNSSRFLGKLQIVDVQANEAVGRIVANDTKLVVAGNEARTQF
ncbi:MAG TPA: hypothetical protein PK402_03695 [Tepidisphaeraceae bacterium]|nr:hypothetical protein [Tepidisphaeraceae bacterium]